MVASFPHLILSGSQVFREKSTTLFSKLLDNDRNKRYRGVKAFAKAFKDAYIKERDIQMKSTIILEKCIYKLDDMLQACDDFTQVIALDRNHCRAYAYRGSAYLGMNRFDKALNDLNLALRLSNGSNIYALMHRGVVYRKKGRYKEAWDDFTQVCDRGYSRPWIEDELEKLRELMRGNRR